jgi:hypothetical protein
MAAIAAAEILRVSLDIEATGESRREAMRSAALSIENNGQAPLRVSRVRPLLPSGVSLIPVAGSSYLRREQRYRDLCGELRLLIQDEYFFSNPGLIAARRQEVVDLINGAIAGAAGAGVLNKVLRIWRVILSPVLAAAAFRRWQDRFNANQLIIEDYDAARAAWELVAKLPPPAHEDQARNRELIELKLAQLKELEDERFSPVPGRGQWTVDPHSTHSEALILRCERGVLSRRRYPIVIEVTGTAADGANPVTKRVSSSIDVPAMDVPLAVLAMLCAPVGLVTRLVVQGPHDPFRVLVERAGTPLLLVASVLGFLLCLSYERLQFGRAAQLSLGWRTAVLLGFGAGVGTENVLKAIEAFFGIS